MATSQQSKGRRFAAAGIAEFSGIVLCSPRPRLAGAAASFGVRGIPPLSAPRKAAEYAALQSGPGFAETATPKNNFPRLAAMAIVAILSVCLFGCAAAPQARPVAPGPAVGSGWIDAIVRPGERLVFAGDNTVVRISRLADRVRIEVQTVLPPIPRLELSADSPSGPPVEFQPGWYRIIRWGLGKPYQVEVVFGQRRIPATSPVGPGDFGTVTYFMPQRTQTDHFHAETVAWTSPVHLLLAALGPLPAGETQLLAMHKDGKDYWATLQADSAGRRIVRFPYALLWGDWSDKNLSEQSVFEIDSADRWPNSTLRATHLAVAGPVVVRYVRTERLPLAATSMNDNK